MVYDVPEMGRASRGRALGNLLPIQSDEKITSFIPVRDFSKGDLLMATAQELCFEMTLEPGDLQLINSHVTYHGRTPFEDDAESGHDRLLLRLWLSMRNNRPRTSLPLRPFSGVRS